MSGTNVVDNPKFIRVDTDAIKTKMESYASSGCTRMITGVNVRDCKLTNYYRASGFDYFELDTTISKIDCSVQNGVVINGDKDNGKFLDYAFKDVNFEIGKGHLYPSVCMHTLNSEIMINFGK